MSESDNFIREVQEEVRKDEMKEFWDKYGRYVMAAAAFVILMTAGKVGYEQYQQSVQQDQAHAYFSALEAAASNPDASQSGLTGLAESTTNGFAFMSRMQRARMLEEAGDDSSVVDILAEAGAQTDSPILASLAEFKRAVRHAAPDDRINALTPLISEDQAWRFFALEAMAMAQLEVGDETASLDSLNLITENDQAPLSLRQRATALTRVIESGSASMSLGMSDQEPKS